MKNLLTVLFFAAPFVACTVPAGSSRSPQEPLELGPTRPSREGDLRAWGSFGRTSSPGGLLAAGQLDIYVADDWAIGPRLLASFDDDTDILAPSFQVKRIFGVKVDGEATRWHPYVQAGAGFAWLQKDLPGPGDAEDEALLLHFGGGVEFALNDRISLGTGVDLDLLPGDALGEDSFVSWRIAEIGIRF